MRSRGWILRVTGRVVMRSRPFSERMKRRAGRMVPGPRRVGRPGGGREMELW